MKNKKNLFLGVVAFAILIVAFGVYKYYSVNLNLKNAESRIASITAEFQAKNTELEGLLAQVNHDNQNLTDALDAEREKVDGFQNDIKKITKTVGTLEKLSQIDPELLKKYSKVYFLNEHYTPPDLTYVSKKFLESQSKLEKVHEKVWPYLKNLLEDAQDDDIDLKVTSAYRSFEEQTSLKGGYKVVYGAGSANQFSADQGYSEHQLGTTVDLTASSTTAFVNFENTEAYKWLLNNAYKYGFVLSYPKGNIYYQFEPWHWRFVGVQLANDLHDDDKFFYDMDQRDIDKYLVEIFD